MLVRVVQGGRARAHAPSAPPSPRRAPGAPPSPRRAPGAPPSPRRAPGGGRGRSTRGELHGAPLLRRTVGGPAEADADAPHHTAAQLAEADADAPHHTAAGTVMTHGKTSGFAGSTPGLCRFDANADADAPHRPPHHLPRRMPSIHCGCRCCQSSASIRCCCSCNINVASRAVWSRRSFRSVFCARNWSCLPRATS